MILKLFINQFMCRIWKNFGGMRFWRIATDEANAWEYFGESDGRSSVASPYFLLEKRIFGHLPKFSPLILSHSVSADCYIRVY